MKAKLLSLDKQEVGEVSLSESIFGLEVRSDIIKRVIDWQRAKAMSGTHKVKTVSEVSGSTKKPFKQKGTGNARQGNNRAVQLRGGGVAHGPVVRSHETKLQKKVRALGLKHALSMKLASGQLYFIDHMNLKEPKTSHLVKSLSNFGTGKYFMIDGQKLNSNFALSARTAKNVVLAPTIGANVYDIVNSDFVLMSKDALSALEGRLK